MKKMHVSIVSMLLLSLVVVSLSSCLKDNATRTYTMYKPIYKTLEQFKADIKSTAPVAVTNPGKLYIIGNYIFLCEKDKGVHIIDNSNPAAPVNKSFINIPANDDIAVYGNTLYADCFTALFTIDITDPLQVKLTKTENNIFPDHNRSYGFQLDINHFYITGWDKKDTTISAGRPQNGSVRGGIYYTFVSDCASCSGTASNAPTSGSKGQGGSMARFAIQNNYLYTVSTNQMRVLSLAQPQQPELKTTLNMSTGIETIYPFQDKLFIGSSSGMFIFSTANPQQPVQMGTFSHARVCDPVIADGQNAYVTLRSGTTCAGFTNQLDVVNIQNLNQPSLVRSYPLTNPRGLSKEGQWLFICDGTAGLKCFDATNPASVTLKTTVAMAETYDVICTNNTAIVSAIDGLYQYDYSNVNSIRLLSKIGLSK